MTNQNNNPIQMLNTLRGANNPQELLMNMAKTNPQLSNIIREVNQTGGDPKKLFYEKANQMGINPETILSQLR